MMSQREEFRWMMLRIKRMAEPWVSAIRSLAAKQNLARRRRKKVGILYTIHRSALDTERASEILSQSGRDRLLAASGWHFVDILVAKSAAHHRSLHIYSCLASLCCVARFRLHQSIFFFFSLKTN